MIFRHLHAFSLSSEVVLLFLLLAGCATGRFLNGQYVDETKGFRVSLPREGWEVMDAERADLALRDLRSPARMAVVVSCPGVEEGPLQALSRHLLFGLREIRVVREEAILLDGVTGLETRVQGRFEGSPIGVRTVVIKRQGCLYDLFYVAPPEVFETRMIDFDLFLRGWQFLTDRP
jgi:hypothetical protein